MVLQASRQLKTTKEITLEDIAGIVEITPNTILETCKLTAEFKNALLPDFWANQRKQ